jgi:hypothetical protein
VQHPGQAAECLIGVLVGIVEVAELLDAGRMTREGVPWNISEQKRTYLLRAGPHPAWLGAGLRGLRGDAVLLVVRHFVPPKSREEPTRQGVGGLGVVWSITLSTLTSRVADGIGSPSALTCGLYRAPVRSVGPIRKMKQYCVGAELRF